ncbi:uncharacterized protein N7515_005472 [Penicillium bovifimosum]|uniref:Uncharacterized protein n=1 Tax=Penicillium bovifimosum TaxID=126998 RepID=A0A9W9GT63_9EURO|nr:uncharacterized protein N7515_005472 [Penicillium bovifimosum]KAJ5129433.1 hypothetical protein N7515_005472 [Penicillium bovifimosum]
MLIAVKIAPSYVVECQWWEKSSLSMRHSPTKLIPELVFNTRSGGSPGYARKEEEGYLVMLASILLLKPSRNTASRFARMLELSLQGTGVKRRLIEVLDGLGVT